MVRMSEVDNDR